MARNPEEEGGGNFHVQVSLKVIINNQKFIGYWYGPNYNDLSVTK